MFHLSKSAHECAKECQRKWYLRYRTSITEDQGSPDARVFGTVCHAVLEDSKCQLPPFNDHMAMIVANSNKEIDEWRAKGVELEIDSQFEAQVYTHTRAVMEALKPYQFNFRSTEVSFKHEDWLSGIVDAVVEDREGNWFILDYKFLSKFLEPEEVKYDLQMHLYAFAHRVIAELVGVDPSNFRGCLYIQCKKSRHKIQGGESFEAFYERKGTGRTSDVKPDVRMTLIRYNPIIANEIAMSHKQLHRSLWTREDSIEAYPPNYLSCNGIYGPCGYYHYCSALCQDLPPVEIQNPAELKLVISTAQELDEWA